MINKTQLLKEMGVSIHVVATGAGAGLQQQLWSIPGSSAYLSGASFPYANEEQEELLGFMPEHFCSEEAAVDLASVAYMKSYRFGGKKPVGVGVTASVASEHEHRGDHRVFVCVMMEDKVRLLSQTLEKGVGRSKREVDGHLCDDLAFWMTLEALGIVPADHLLKSTDASEMALARFMLRPHFTANGKRLEKVPKEGRYALMPGAFNPPHEGHFGVAEAALKDYNHRTVFE